jgi:hypothetical protein
VRLGKAVPDSLDIPSLLVQLNAAARGTGIGFDEISVGERLGAPAVAASNGTTGGTGSQPAKAGGTPASSAPGKVAEGAGNAVNNANANSADRGQLDTTTSKTTRQGGLPVGGGSTSAPTIGDQQSSGVAGLDKVPLVLSFHGRFFSLADFFHRVKRFVRVAGQRIEVGGRLVMIDGFSFQVPRAGEFFKPGDLKSSLRATVYLVPKAEGVAAGATPSGPAPSQSTQVSGSGSSSTPTPAAATVTP